MIIYNTTYTVENAEARNFIIWIHEVFIPSAQEGGTLRNVRLLHILSHKDPDTECFSVQFQVDSTAILQQWYAQKGQALLQELVRVFGQKVVGFSTIMDDITLEMPQ